MIRRLFWLLFAFSLAGITASSLALFAGPSTEVAQWSQWTFLGLSRPRLESLHYGLGLLLIVSGLVNLFTGAGRMMAEGESDAPAGPIWIIALLIFTAVTLACALMLPPGGTLTAMSSSLKTWHAKSFGEPPLAGAAALSPTELAKRLSLDPAKSLANLAAHNVKLSSPDATIAELARLNGLAPAAVYETMRGGKEPRLPAPPAPEAQKAQTPPAPPQLPADPPPGLGRLKLADVCEQYGVNLAAAVDKLAKSGIKASGDMTLRQIAQNNLMLAIEVYDALRATPQGAPAPAPAPQAQAGQSPAQAPQPAPFAGPGQIPAAPGQPSVQAPGQVSGQQPGLAPGQPAPQASAQTPGLAPGQPAPGQAPAQAVPQAAPEGLERMTLSAFCRERGIETAQALAKLKAKGIVAFSDMTFRELALENNLTPEQVMQLVAH